MAMKDRRKIVTSRDCAAIFRQVAKLREAEGDVEGARIARAQVKRLVGRI